MASLRWLGRALLRPSSRSVIVRGIGPLSIEELATRKNRFHNYYDQHVRLFASDGGGGGGGGGDDGGKDQDRNKSDKTVAPPDDDDDNGREKDLAQGTSGMDETEIAKTATRTNPPGEEDDDPFGLQFDDAHDKLGPTLPPQFQRDAATGRLTGKIISESSEEERILLNDPAEQDRVLEARLQQRWKDVRAKKEWTQFGEQVRQSNMGTNVLGRSVKAQASEDVQDDGSKVGRDPTTKFSQPLTRQEFKAFQQFSKDQFDLHVSEEDVPVMDDPEDDDYDNDIDNDADDSYDSAQDPDESTLALKWLSAKAQRQMDDLLDDNPYTDLMPGDLSPTRLVNRKQAKPIPVELLHHNNVELLQRFITPTGQIRNRVQTRLGARDQRRVAKLIKRARCLGLIPFQGQFKTEHHGWKHATDLMENRPWENELIERGLVITKKQQQQRQQKVTESQDE